MNKLPIVISSTPASVENPYNKIPTIFETTKLLKKGNKLKTAVIRDLLVLYKFSKSGGFIDSLVMRGYLNLLKTNLTNKQVTRLLKNNKELMEIFM